MNINNTLYSTSSIFFSANESSNFMIRLTSILACLFFLISLALNVVNNNFHEKTNDYWSNLDKQKILSQIDNTDDTNKLIKRNNKYIN